MAMAAARRAILMAARLAVAMGVRVTVMLAFPARRGLLEVSLQAFDTTTLTLDYVFDMRNAVKVNLELVHLRHDVLESCNLCIRIVYEIPSAVVLLESNDGALFTEILDALLDLLHQSVQMT